MTTHGSQTAPFRNKRQLPAGPWLLGAVLLLVFGLGGATAITTGLAASERTCDDGEKLRQSNGCRFRQADIESSLNRGGDYRGAVLDGLDLSRKDLRGARFQGASLVGVQLNGAKLQGAHLEGTDLDGAGLIGACLIGAHLEGASASGATLTGSDVSGAHLQGATGLLLDHESKNTAACRD